MLKKQSKAIAIAMAIVFCLSFIAVAPPAAQATSTYTVLSCPSTNQTANVALGKVQVDIPNIAALSSPDILSVSLPTGVTFGTPVAVGGTAAPDVTITTPAQMASALNNPLNNAGAVTTKVTSLSTFDIKLDKNNFQAGAPNASFTINFDSFDLSGQSGDISVGLYAADGSGLTSNSVVIAKFNTSGSTAAMAKSVKSVAKGGVGQTIDTIVLMENSPGSFGPATSTIKYKLPSGYKWNLTKNVITMYGGSWSYDNQNNVGGNFTLAGDGTQTLTVTINTGANNTTTAGRLNLGVEIGANNRGLAAIDVPENAANGDVIVTVSGSASGVTEQDIVIATVGDYGTTITGETKTEIYAGKIDQKIGPMVIEEALAASLIQDRTIRFTLPDGVKWATNPTVETISGSNVIGAWTTSTDSQYKSTTITALSTKAAKIRLKDAKVEVSPSFSGEIKVKVSGTAGLAAEVPVADVKPLVGISVASVKDVVVGMPNQAVGDVVIKETKKGAIMDAAGNNLIILSLPDGFTFAGKPTVKVTEGNASVDSYKLTNSDNDLQITMDSASTNPSSITVSDIKLTAVRYVPEGPVKITLAGGATNSSALDETTLWAAADRSSAGNAVIANCATPAPAETAKVGQFNLGSNIFYVNGAAKIMDVAPYVKDARTYVPVRFLGYALGLTDEMIKWDAAAQTVTFAKGADTVVVTIGSKTLTKNGTASTMDVAPEIKDGRTMLPARFIAEAFGAEVGWNAATSTVLIQSK